MAAHCLLALPSPLGSSVSHVLLICILSFPILLCLTIKELQKAIDNRKAIILSINLCSSEFTQSESEESKKLQERLSQMNVSWDHVCSTMEDWRCSLQDALMQCQVCIVLGLSCPHPTSDVVLWCAHYSIWNLPVQAKIQLWCFFSARYSCTTWCMYFQTKSF